MKTKLYLVLVTLHYFFYIFILEGRKLTDVKSRLQRNSQLQRGAQADALYAVYNRQALDSDEKIKVCCKLYMGFLIIFSYQPLKNSLLSCHMIYGRIY